MVFTGRLGQHDSRLGRLQLSERGSLVFEQTLGSTLLLSGVGTSGVYVNASSELELFAFLTYGYSGTGESTMPFTSRLGQSDSRLGQFQLSELATGGGGIFEEALQSNMTLGQSVVVFTLTPHLTDTLALTSIAVATNLAVQEPESILALSQSAAQAGPINRTASSVLVLTDVAEAVGYFETESELILTSAATLEDGVPIYRSASNALALLQTADPGFIPIKQVTSVLALVQSTAGTGVPISASASSPMTLTQLAYSNIQNVIAGNLELLFLTQTAYAGQPVNVTATTTLELLDVATPGIIVESLASVLGLTQEAVGDTTIQRREVAQALVLAQAITMLMVHNQTATSTLALTDLAVKNQIPVTASSVLALVDAARTPRQVSVVHTLSIQQAVRVSPINVSASSVLALTQTHNVARPHYAETETHLTIVDPEQVVGDPDTGEGIIGSVAGLQQAVDVHFGIANVNVTSYISLAQQMGQTKQVFADSTIELVSSAEQAVGYIEEILALVQTILAETSKPGSSTLAIEQSASFLVDRSPAPTSTLSLGQTAAHAIDSDSNICQYSPFGPLPAAPTLGSAQLTLTYPYVTPSLTVQLRNPEFNNSERLELTRISRVTRGGTLVVFADTIWPKVKILSMKVTALSDAQRAALLTFLDSSIGKEIGLLDHENRQWRGIILNPNTPLIHQHNCKHELDLEFEGELV